MLSYRDGFSQLDLAIVLGVLLGTIYIATFHILFGRHSSVTSVKGFIIGERDLPLFPATTSLACVVAPLYVIMPVWSIGINPLLANGVQLACALGALIGALFSYTFVTAVQYEVFAEESSISIYSYLEKRFRNRFLATAAAVVFVFQAVVLLTAVLYLTSLSTAAVTGFPIEMFILLTGIISSLYTALAGIRYVLWASLYQCALLAIGFLISAGGSAQIVGGVIQLLRNHTYSTIQALNPALVVSQAGSFWIILPAFFIHWSLAFIALQPLAQVILSVETSRNGLRCVLMGSATIGLLLILASVTSSGLLNDCSSALTSIFNEYGQIAPLLYFVQKGYKNVIGADGLFVAAILNASIGFMSAWSVSISAVVLENFIAPLITKSSTEKSFDHTLQVAKLFGFIPGALAICIALAFNRSLWSFELTRAILALVIALTGPLASLFLLGTLVPTCNDKGALFGFSCGIKLCLTVSAIAAYQNDFMKYLGMSASTEAITNSVGKCSPQGNITNFESIWQPFVWGAPASMLVTLLGAITVTIIYALFIGTDSTPPNVHLHSLFVLLPMERASCVANQEQLKAPVKLLSARSGCPEEISASSAN